MKIDLKLPNFSENILDFMLLAYEDFFGFFIFNFLL